MDAFTGRPDLLIIFIAQIAFIILQILIYLRLSREEKQFHARVETKSKIKDTKTPAKRKLGRRTK